MVLMIAVVRLLAAWQCRDCLMNIWRVSELLTITPLFAIFGLERQQLQLSCFHQFLKIVVIDHEFIDRILWLQAVHNSVLTLDVR